VVVRLLVRHATTWRYSRPMKMLVQSLRLDPSRFDGQRTGRWIVTARGGREGSSFRDGAGDLIRTLSVRGPVTELTVEVEGSVETTDLSGVLRGHREVVPPAAYLRATRATRSDVGVVELARGVMAAHEGAARLGLAHALSGAVSDAIAFEAGVTGPGTTAAEALALGKGVCQDHAHALIAAALVAGIPARYVVGYLFSKAEAEASHAWAELWIDGLGWVGFDAANRCCPDDRYIRLCSGHDAQDAAPIRGVAPGEPAESLEVQVAVQQANQ
jgi:transglutaminase-like putative cysteine protease